ncbi:MAG: tetratricopeptide repeat protein [Lewinellaceae bacterium]|nr:tetratricopeptide repeat protein [Lewinellaceae bacterium]
MKTIPSFLWLILIGTGLQSCMHSTTLQVLQPADMRLPEHISTIATIDRSKPSNGFVNVLEGLFTGEAIGQDKRGRLSALDGLTYSLTRTPRFQVKPTDVELEGTNTGNNMAPPLPWAEIESICDRYGADAVLAIEQYDSDAIVSTRSFQEKYKDKEGVERFRTRYRADAALDVTIGWRLYDPSTKIIEDEFSVHLDENYSANGDQERQARSNLPDPARRSFDLSYKAGQRYGMRIAPVWVPVSRAFFTSGKGIYKETMKQAARMADSENWDKAVEVWTDLVSTADPKTAGRAAHNLAVSSERLGRLEEAVDWAEKAWLTYGNKTSRNYLGVLRQRIEDDRKARSQLPSRT